MASRYFVSLFFPAALLFAQTKTISIEEAFKVKADKLKTELADHKGRKALRVTDAGPAADDDRRILVLPETEFEDGVIELELTGEPGSAAGPAARGFVGIAFRAAPDASRFECFYLRPTNGRAEDQVRRNHSAQYISVPGFPWPKLRKEFPEMYESYVDLVPGEWTKVRVEARGATARLFVHGAAQPTLIVTALKQPPTKGAVALWVGPGTVAHFSAVKISR